MDSMLRNMHFYRKTPQDLTHGTSSGGAVSIVALLVMAFLFVSQMNMYFTVQIKTDVMMDPQHDGQDTMAIDFDITVAKVPCRLLTVDLYDVLGTARVNMTEDAKERNFRIAKTSVITNSDMMYIPGAKKKVEDGPLPREIFQRHHSEGEAMKAISKFPVSEHRNWQDDWDEEIYSKTLTDDNFDDVVSKYKLVMVNFHAPWCPWCARLKPVWEHAAGLIEKTTTDYGEADTFHGFKDRHEGMYAWEEYNMAHEEDPMTLVDFLNQKRSETGMGPIPNSGGAQRALLAKVDCTKEQMLCRRHRVMGFPTVRIYTPKPGDKNSLRSMREYEGDRTAQDILQYVHESMPSLEGFTELDAEFEELQRQRESELSTVMEKRIRDHDDSHGCNIIGTVTVNKVPGTLMLTAHSNYKSLSLENLNMSHIIHHMAYRPTKDPILRKLEVPTFEAHMASFDTVGSDTVGGKDDVAPPSGYGSYARNLMRDHVKLTKESLQGYSMGSVVPFLFPLDQSRFTGRKPRSVLTHYLKVVHTFIQPAGGDPVELFQHQVHSTTDVVLPEGGHPSLNFTYDMSPLAYTISGKHEPTADFLTSTCAIIGGVFTTIGLFDNVIYHGATSLLKFL